MTYGLSIHDPVADVSQLVRPFAMSFASGSNQIRFEVASSAPPARTIPEMCDEENAATGGDPARATTSIARVDPFHWTTCGGYARCWVSQMMTLSPSMADFSNGT